MATLLSINYASAVNGIAYDVTAYERTPHGSDAADPLNPYVVATDEVEVSGGVLTVKDGNDSNWSLAGVSFGGFGPEDDGFWDATQGCAAVTYLFTAGALDDVNIGPLMLVQKNELHPDTPYPLRLTLEDNLDSPQTFNLRLLARGWDADIEDTSVNFDRDELEGQTITVRVEWQCGTLVGGSPSDVTADGFIKVYFGSTLVLNLTGLDLIISDDQAELNWANGFSVGYSGLMGQVSRIQLANNLCGSSRNFLWGQGHAATGSDNLMSGRQGTLVGERNVFFNLDGVTRSRTRDGALTVHGDFYLNDTPASRLLGRGSAGGAGKVEEIEIGSGLAMSGTTLIATGGGSPGSPSGVDGLLSVIFVRKTSDESLNSSASLQADNELLFAVDANEEWEFEFHVVYLGNTTGDFRCGLKFPTSPTEISYYIDGIISSGANDGGTGFNGDRGLTHAIADAVSGAILGAGTNKSVARLKGFLRNGANAGNVVLWWAQGTSDGTNTTVKAGSWVKALRLA